MSLEASKCSSFCIILTWFYCLNEGVSKHGSYITHTCSFNSSPPTQSEMSSHEYTKPGYMKMKDLVDITTHNHMAIYNGTNAAGDVIKMTSSETALI